MSETFDSIREWADDTFGPISAVRVITRAQEEMAELCDAALNQEPLPTLIEEAADVVICLARFPGLQEAIDRKMAVNRKRKWAVKGDGTGYHIKEPAHD